jgi:hypothetical protein
MILLIWMLAGLEIWWDWRLIERKQMSPNYRGSNKLRVAVGTLVWILWPVFVDVSHAQWLFSPVMMFCNFWFMFDYGLNKARKKDFDYLGSNRIDQWQKDHGGERLWFWIKAGLAVASVGIYYWL